MQHDTPPVQQHTSGLTPLSDLGQCEYRGFQGGLYPEGENTRPVSHEAAGVERARQIQPLDAEGKPIEFDDTVEAVKALRKMPFIDPARIGLLGCSHGVQVGSRVISRADIQGAILCAPAALDLIQVKKAAQRGEPMMDTPMNR